MRLPSRKNDWKRFGPFMVLALLVHLACLPMLSLVPSFEAKSLNSKPIEVALVPSSKNLKPRKTVSKQTIKKKKAKKKEIIPKGQIVNLPSTPDADEPENARFLAKTNSKTERETKSRHRTTLYKNAGNEVSRKADGPKDKSNAIKVDAPVEIRTPKGEMTGKDTSTQKTGKFELPSMKMRDALQLELDPDFGNLANRSARSRLEGQGSALRLSTGEGDTTGNGRNAANTRRTGSNVPDLIPSMGVLAALDAAPASDRLKDVEEGEGTFLNARRFKYASFFDRVHKGVSNVWQPLKEYRRSDPNGQVYGRATRVTVLNVTLNADGDLTKVGVARSSGIGFLDQEAISAFRRAQPFPNPPAGLLENEVINFNFGFSLVLSPRGPFEPRF